NQDALLEELAPADRAALRADLEHLDASRLLAFAPRDEPGRLLLGETVLLASYGAPPPPAGRRGTWLAARTPERRRDPQVLTVGLTQLVGSYYAHRWDSARWLWDRRAAGAAEAARWGVEGLELERLGLAGRAEQLAHFERLCAGSAPPA